MCEFKEKNDNEASGSKKNVATIENGAMPTEVKKARSVNFEVALAETTFGKFNYCLIIIAGLVLTNVLLETLGISFVLPVSECDLNFSTQQKGILSAIGFAGIITSSHLWGFLADTTGRRRVIRPTLIIGFILTVISSFMNSFWPLVILRFLNGIFVSGGSATVYVYLGEFHTSKTRSRAIMGASFIFGVGCMLLPTIAWVVINQEWNFYIPYLDIMYRPWRLFMIVCGIPGLFCALCLFKIPESPKFMMSQNRMEDALKVLQTMYSANTGKDRIEFTITSIEQEFNDRTNRVTSDSKSNPAVALFRSMWDQTAPLFMRPHLRTTLVACAIQFGIFATSNGMYMWFPDILNIVFEYIKENPNNHTSICNILYHKRMDLSISQNKCNPLENESLEISTYQYTLVLEILYALGFAVIGFIINTVGKLSILVFVLVLCGASGIVAVLIETPMYAIYFYLILLACGLGITIVNAATVDLFPTHLRAMAVCISLMMGRLGSVVGANLMGVLLDNSCITAFMTSGISLIVCGLLAFFLPKVPKGPSAAPSRRVSLTSLTGN